MSELWAENYNKKDPMWSSFDGLSGLYWGFRRDLFFLKYNIQKRLRAKRINKIRIKKNTLIKSSNDKLKELINLDDSI